MSTLARRTAANPDNSQYMGRPNYTGLDAPGIRRRVIARYLKVHKNCNSTQIKKATGYSKTSILRTISDLRARGWFIDSDKSGFRVRAWF